MLKRHQVPKALQFFSESCKAFELYTKGFSETDAVPFFFGPVLFFTNAYPWREQSLPVKKSIYVSLAKHICFEIKSPLF
ncbi:hypothetical protein DWX23_10285 [Parabacteroides sp. AF18-52]|nr:hypothetical protein DWX23_10285 [Parabacteroides sp. AF18-52]